MPKCLGASSKTLWGSTPPWACALRHLLPLTAWLRICLRGRRGEARRGEARRGGLLQEGQDRLSHSQSPCYIRF